MASVARRPDTLWGPAYSDLRLLGFGGKGMLAVVRSAAKKSDVALPLLEAAVRDTISRREANAWRAAELFALQLALAAASSLSARSLQRAMDAVPDDINGLDYASAVGAAEALTARLFEAIDGGVGVALVDEGAATLARVELRIRCARQAAEATLSLAALAPLATRVDALRTHHAAAEATHADPELLLEASQALVAAQKRDEATAALEALTTSGTHPAHVDTPKLRAAWAAALASAVPAHTLERAYYKEHPRDFEDDWPNERHVADDVRLRAFLGANVDTEPKEIVRLAREDFGIALTKD